MTISSLNAFSGTVLHTCLAGDNAFFFGSTNAQSSSEASVLGLDALCNVEGVVARFFEVEEASTGDVVAF